MAHAALLRHDRMLVLAGLAGVIALSWIWLLTGAGLHMDEMDMGGGQVMLMAPAWTAGYAATVFLMWIVMMAAMMLPSAAPAILLVAALARQRGERHAIVRAGNSRSGYLAIWAAFSLLATGLQFALDRAGLLSGRHGQRQRRSRRAAVDRGRDLSMDPVETGVPATLPLADRVSHSILGAGCFRPDARGRVARGVLPRMLLDADGAAVRRRPHEHVLDRRAGASGADREAVPVWPPREPDYRRGSHRLGRVRARPLSSRRNSGFAHWPPTINTVRLALSSRGHACSTSDSGTGVVAILRPAGTAARNTPPTAWTKRSKGMLPMPLPISRIAEERARRSAG